MVHRYSLFYYLLSIILISSSIILAIVIIGNRNLLGHVLLSHQEEKFEFITEAASEEIELRLTNVEGAIRRNALLFAEEGSHTREDSVQILRQTLGSFPTIFAMEIIFTETEQEQKDQSGFSAIYAYRENSKSLTSEAEFQKEDELAQLAVVDRTDIAADYQADWYTEPVKQKKAVWSPPYKDPQIDVWMITFSVPVFSAPDRIEAIMTADVSLEWLNKLIDTFPVGLSGKPVLVTPSQVIYSSNTESEPEAETDSGKEVMLVDMDQDVNIDVKEIKSKSGSPIYTNMAEFLANSESGKIRFTNPAIDDETKWFYFSTLPKISWKLGCIIPEKSISRAVHRMTKRIVGFGMFGCLLLIIPSFFIAHSVAQPLSILSRCAGKVAGGNFDEPLPELAGNGEIPQLFRAFDSMRRELKKYIQNITEAAKKEAGLNSQLRIAHSIQQGMVPKNFEPARQGKLDLFAQMKPAQDVGGDLYDYEVLENGNVYFCLGDVSGKGIPASLFMAIGKTLIRSAIQRDDDPAKALSWVNHQLMESNDAGLFITALCGIYYAETHEIVVSCAGHNPPYLRSADGKTEQVNITNGKFPLAIMDDVEYENYKIQLPQGTSFFVYSDGVTDAANPDGNFFGENNLEKYLSAAPDDSSQTIVESMMAEIARFADGAKQSDDITILSFREIT